MVLFSVHTPAAVRPSFVLILCLSRSNLWPNIRRCYGHFNLWSLFKTPSPIPQVVKAGKWENVLSFGFFFRVISPPFLFFHIPPAPIGPLFKSSFFFFLLLLYSSFRLLCCWRIYCATSKVSFWNLYSVIHYFISILYGGCFNENFYILTFF